MTFFIIFICAEFIFEVDEIDWSWLSFTSACINFLDENIYGFVGVV